MSTLRQIPGAPAVPVLSVRTEDGRTSRWSRPFHIGREHDCEVRIDDGRVSRKHVVVSFEDGQWLLRDRQSGNGVFVDGRRVETVAIDKSVSIRLGADGPLIRETYAVGAQGIVEVKIANLDDHYEVAYRLAPGSPWNSPTICRVTWPRRPPLSMCRVA